MNGQGKSDSSIVPKKCSNKTGTGSAGAVTCETKKSSGSEADRDQKLEAESMEGRGLAKGNSDGQSRDRTQRRASLKQALDRVRQAARRDKEVQMTALWHHVYNVDRLQAAYHGISRKAAAGVDEVTWKEYGENLESNLQELSMRLEEGSYRASPVVRVYVPKADGKQRPIGIPVLEDKIVQRATVEVLNAVYEEEFLGFSYGFRPGRSQHQALDALWVGLVSKKVNWVFDMDIRGFFDSIDHQWMVRMVERRIGDRRVVRHVQKWLKAGVLENGELREVGEGTPQGGSISPLLANIYLHYAFDRWAHKWRQQEASGDVIIVRYADDIVMGFEHHKDAKRFWEALAKRLQRLHLELHPEKTRLLEFGRYAAERRYRRSEPRPEVFKFLGFVHACGTSREGRFVVRRRTDPRRMRAKLKQIRVELRQRMHEGKTAQGKWLATVLRGYYQYHAVPGNLQVLEAFRWKVRRAWIWTLSRRSQRERTSLRRMGELAHQWLPYPHVIHPCPLDRLCV